MKRRSFEQSDHIRLNLEWLDRQQKPDTPFFYRMCAHTPLLPLVLSTIAGIAIASKSPPSIIGMGLLICVPTALALSAVSFLKSSVRLKLVYSWSAAVLVFACLGAARLAAIRYCPPGHIRHLIKEPDQLATLRGTIISPINTSDSQSGLSSIPWLNEQSSFYLSVNGIKNNSDWKEISGTIRVQVNERIENIYPGNEILLYCRLNQFHPPPNPGQFNLRQYMHNRGVYVGASVPLAEGIEVINKNRSLLYRLRSLLYRFSTDALLDETTTDRDVRSLVSALLLGRRSSLNPAIVSAFQKTNLAHFISLSGMHIGILAGSLWILLRWTQIPKRPRALLCIILILTYAMIVPPRAPTMRAVLLSCFFFASCLLGRRVHPLNTLSLSAIVLLLLRPYELFSAGWQLSFLSVFGILLLYTPVRYQLLDKLFFPLVYMFNKRFIGLQHLIYRALEMLAVGIAAWVMIAPVMLYHFGQINLLSPLWTVLVFPAVLVILYAGFLKIIFASPLPSMAAVLSILLNLAARTLKKVVLLLSRIDFLQITSHHPSWSHILLFYFLLSCMFFIPMHYRKSRRHLVLLLILCVLLPAASQWSLFNEQKLEMTCLCVGHGQAVVMSTPDREHFLFDAGSITHQNIARRIITPYLRQRCIFDLDGVYISHGDMDHLNAIPAITDTLNTHAVYGNPVFLENAQKPSIEKTVIDHLRHRDVKISPIQTCQYDNVIFQNLWPPPDFSEKNLSDNDRSQVLLIAYAGRKILLCGDIETYTQNKILQLYPDLKVDVMILPHHGSTVNLNPRFVGQLSPSVLIASCARRSLANVYHPPAATSMECFYTPIDGAVTITIKADGTLSAAGYLN